MIEIYTDGSCDVHHTKHGSSAYVILLDKELIYEDVTFYKCTTNNRTEAQAAINALNYLSKYHGPSKYFLHSDSDLLVNTANLWMHNWAKKSWKRKKNAPVSNLDLIKELYDLYSFHNGSFKWIKAHAGNKWNEYCDNLCRESDEYNILDFLANNQLE
jgi:ribonuclease HI